jgi:hypothetical protein
LTIEQLMTRRSEVEFPVTLSQAQCEQFRPCGFTSIARITTDEELASMGEVYDRLFAERIIAARYIRRDRIAARGFAAHTQTSGNWNR